MGKSAKENIIASRSVGSEIFAGGIVAAANHAADFCAEVEIITGLGRQDSHEQLIRDSLRDNVKSNFVYRAGIPPPVNAGSSTPLTCASCSKFTISTTVPWAARWSSNSVT